MMKNKMMRLASVLLVAVLLSTCAISGTFAKYVTTASGTDNARVAKWGIVMDNTGSAMFQDTYYVGEGTSNPVVNGEGKTLTEGIVAPGTSGSSTYKISGTPETDYKISFSYKTEVDELKDVYLGAGTYTYNNTDEKGEYADDTTDFQEAKPYYPIKYKIVITTKDGVVLLDNTKIADYEKSASVDQDSNDTYTLKNIETLENALKQLKATTIAFENNVECDVEVTLSWEWDFDQTDSNANADLYDTILGELAVGNASDLTAAPGAKYSTEIKFTLIMTATQTNE